MLEFLNTLINTWWGITIISIIAALVWLLFSVIFYRQFFKRLYDIVLSGIALIISSPILLIMLILVRTKLGSPVMFKQYRPGKNNKIFVIHKFRTMTSETDENGQLLPDAQRMTKFGKFIRSTSLDELPQIWDIFRGKMSIIGPRPKLVKDVVFMDEIIIRRHDVRGGLTGLAQVNGRNNLPWDKVLEYDLQYVDNYSFWMDFKIFIKTIGIVIKRKDINKEGTVTHQTYGETLLTKNAITNENYEEGLRKSEYIIKEFINLKQNN